MSAKQQRLVDVAVLDVRRRVEQPEGDYHVIILGDGERERRLPIWVGQAEGVAVAMYLGKTATPRP